MHFSSNLTKIGEYAFDGCRLLKNVDLSNTSIEKIGVFAFAECSSLETVKLPKSLEISEDAIFSDCHSLKKVIVEKALEDMEKIYLGCKMSVEICLK